MGAGQALAGLQLGLPVAFLMVADVIVDVPDACAGILDRAYGAVAQAQSLALAGKLPVDRRRGLLQPLGKGGAIADQMGGSARHCVGKFVERIQQRGFFPPVL